MSPFDPARGSVRLRGAHPATEILLIDSGFKLRARAVGELRWTGPAGVYKARFQLGAEHHDVLCEIHPGRETTCDGPEALTVPIAPLLWAGLRDLDEGVGPGEREGTLQVCAWSAKEPGRALQLQAVGSGRRRPLRWREVAGLAVGSARLPPGTYVLSAGSGGERVCRAVPVLPGHRSLVVLADHEPADPPPAPGSTLAESTLLISGEDGGATLLLQDLTQQALGRGRAYLEPDDLRRLSDDPGVPALLLLLGAHGLLAAARLRARHPADPVSLGEDPLGAVAAAHPPGAAGRARRSHREDPLGAVAAAYRRLRRTELADTPDVAALGFVTGEPPSRVVLDVPPLLDSTWRTLSAASSDHPRAIGGGAAAMRVADGRQVSPLWLIWSEPERTAGRRARGHGLTSATREVLAPALRSSAGHTPSWVSRSTTCGDLARASPDQLARILQAPVELVTGLARAVDLEQGRRERARSGRRLRALAAPDARICLVVVPDGVRIDPVRGQAIDFDLVFGELADDAAAAAGLVAIRAPPVGIDAPELEEALAFSDVLLVDVSYADPRVMAALGRWSGPGEAVRIRADGHPAPAGPGRAPPLRYLARPGADPVFADPAGFRRAIRKAAAGRRRTRAADARRRAWLAALARAEEQHFRLGVIRRGRQEALAIRRLDQLFPDRVLRRQPSSVQLDVFLSYRARCHWTGMIRSARAMRGPLQQTVVVREQLALALNRTGAARDRERAERLLRSVLDDLGPNGETCGLLGRIFKDRWREAIQAGDAGAERLLDQAIHWYAEGVRASPLDPYPGVNALTLLSLKDAPAARAEHSRLLPLVGEAAQRRLYWRPNYWDFASLMEIAANKGDRRACEWYQRLAMASAHEPWQRRSAAQNLALLLGRAERLGEPSAAWLSTVTRATEAGQPAPWSES